MSRPATSFGENLSITGKGLLLLAIPVVAQIAILLFLRTVQVNVDDAERLAIHSQDVILQTTEIERLAFAGVAGQRGAVITGDPDFRDPSDGPAPSLHGLADSLAKTVTDNPQQHERVLALVPEVDALETWLTEQRNLVRQGRRDEAAMRVRDLDGSNRLTAVRTGLAVFLREEERLAAERSATLHAITAQSRAFTILAVVFSVAVAGLLAYLFSRAIGSRFAHVTDNAARMANNEPLTPPLGGTDEIAGLDRVLQDTAARLGAAAAAAEHARRELEKRLDEVGQLNLELRQTTEENETFIYSVSHDLRSPLVNLQGFSKELTMTCAQLEALLDSNALPPALREQARKLVEGDIAESLAFIKTAVSRASLIIDSLLRLSRAGRVEYRWQYVTVSRIVKNVVDAMRITIGERKAEVVVRGLDDAWGDATALEQVFANLIGNAVMYLDPNRPGGVEIGMEPTPAAMARVSSQPPSRTYYIRDNGLGLPAAAIGKLFTAFHRYHSGQAPGEGVGLALVRRIVERHHGRIWVDSQEGVGSTFYVELPAEPAVSAAAPTDSAAQGRPDLAPASS